MGSIRHQPRNELEATRYIYRVVVPYTRAADPDARRAGERVAGEGTIVTDYYRSRQQANGAATRRIRRFDNYRARYGDGEPLYTFGKRQMQRAELTWAVEQAPVWEPVN